MLIFRFVVWLLEFARNNYGVGETNKLCILVEWSSGVKLSPLSMISTASSVAKTIQVDISSMI